MAFDIHAPGLLLFELILAPSVYLAPNMHYLYPSPISALSVGGFGGGVTRRHRHPAWWVSPRKGKRTRSQGTACKSPRRRVKHWPTALSWRVKRKADEESVLPIICVFVDFPFHKVEGRGCLCFALFPHINWGAYCLGTKAMVDANGYDTVFTCKGRCVLYDVFIGCTSRSFNCNQASCIGRWLDKVSEKMLFKAIFDPHKGRRRPFTCKT